MVLAITLFGAALAQDTGEVRPTAEVEEFATDKIGEDLFVETTLDSVSDADLQTAFRRMKRADDIQWELRTDPPVRRETPGWLEAVADFITNIIAFLMPAFKIIFWLGVAALALVLIYALINALRGMEWAKGDDDDDLLPPEYRPSARTARILLEQADALAAQGRYAEAIHLLLYRSIQDIEASRPDAVRLSLTSREIGASEALGARTRATFAQLARIVEGSHFGGRDVDGEDYTRARALYEDFATPRQPDPRPPLSEGQAA